MGEKQRRKVCFVITSFIHYSRNFLILEDLNNREDVELHVVLGGVVLSDKYASHTFNVGKILKNEGFKNIHEAYFNVDGDHHMVKAKTIGLGVIEFSSLFHDIQPDVLVVRGDRFEVLAAAIAAAYMNIPIAHIEGGDVSGTLDESVRHAITKLAHIHFATNEPARERILRMGENAEYVFNFGSPDIEVVLQAEKQGIDIDETDFDQAGSGTQFSLDEKYVMVMYHPVNTELESLSENTRKLLVAVHKLDMPVIWFWPNFDAGAEYISHELRMFKEKTAHHKVKFLRYLPPRQFLSLLTKSKCLIGNSSAGIKECSYLGIPVVNVGSRQNNRLRADNVVDCGNDSVEAYDAIRKQLSIGRYPSSNLYASNNTSREIARVLSEVDLYTQKNFID